MHGVAASLSGLRRYQSPAKKSDFGRTQIGSSLQAAIGHSLRSETRSKAAPKTLIVLSRHLGQSPFGKLARVGLSSSVTRHPTRPGGSNRRIRSMRFSTPRKSS